MRTLITGANGFLGSWLARRLAARGDEVRCLVRSTADRSALSDVKVTLCEGDITAPASLASAAEGVDVVFHLAGLRRAPSPEPFFQVNAEGTRHVCEAMVRAGAKRLVLCSSLAASGPSRPERPKVESDPFAPEEWYGQSKAESERIAFSYADRLEVTAARPPRIIGPGDRENLVFFKLVKKGIKLVLGGGPRPLSMVDVDDVAELLVLLAERREALGEAFFVTAPETTTIEQIQDDVARVLGLTPRAIYVPPAVLRGLGAVADVASKLSGKHLPLNRKLARQLLAPAWTCSGEKAERLLGYRPSRTITDSVRRSAEWYREHRWI